MLKIKIDKTEYDYLLSSNLDEKLIESIKKNHSKEFDSIYLKLPKDNAEDILEFLGNELSKNVFKITVSQMHLE